MLLTLRWLDRWESPVAKGAQVAANNVCGDRRIGGLSCAACAFRFIVAACSLRTGSRVKPIAEYEAAHSDHVEGSTLVASLLLSSNPWFCDPGTFQLATARIFCPPRRDTFWALTTEGLSWNDADVQHHNYIALDDINGLVQAPGPHTHTHTHTRHDVFVLVRYARVLCSITGCGPWAFKGGGLA
jgi:hypothetical protein